MSLKFITLSPGTIQPSTYLGAYLLQCYRVFLNLKRKVGYPYTYNQFWDIELSGERQNKDLYEMKEMHFQHDEMYVAKTIGMLECYHIHLFSHHMLKNGEYKALMYSRYDDLKFHDHLTQSHSTAGERHICDYGFTEYLSTVFVKKKLKALSLLNDKTINERFYDKVLCEGFRLDVLKNRFGDIAEACYDLPRTQSYLRYQRLKYITSYEDSIKLSALISEIRNRLLHRYHVYNHCSLLSEPCPVHHDYDDAELDIQKMQYLKAKGLIVKPRKLDRVYFSDDDILQNLAYNLHSIVIESINIHQAIFRMYLKEELKLRLED